MDIPGRDPERWKFDAVGNKVCFKVTGCEGCLCHEYDHIVPFSKGGKSTLENCQILQTRVNRFKGADTDDKKEMNYFSCSRQFSDFEMDIFEMALYGNVRRFNEASGNFEVACRVKSIMELLPGWRDRKDKSKKEKENDKIPMCKINCNCS